MNFKYEKPEQITYTVPKTVKVQRIPRGVSGKKSRKLGTLKQFLKGKK